MAETARRTIPHSRVRGRFPVIIAALLNARSDVEAAALAGISRSSLVRLKRIPEFIEAWHKAQDRQLEDAIGALKGNALLFTDTLREIAGDPKAQANARARSCEIGYNVMLKWVELHDIMRRLEKLEQAAAEGRK